jgi:hypothetical protein
MSKLTKHNLERQAMNQNSEKPHKGRIENWTFHNLSRKTKDFVVIGEVYDYPDWTIRQGEYITTSLVVSVGYDQDNNPVRVETENSRYDLGKPYKVSYPQAEATKEPDNNGS